jgi:hypothetical protein
VTVNSARGKQAENMHCALGADRVIDRPAQSRIVKKLAIFDGLVDARQRLVNDPPGSQVHVSHLGVTHLTFRQPYGQARGSHQGVLGVGPEPVPDRCVSAVNGVVIGFFAVSPAVQNQQQGSPFLRVAH